MLQELPKVGDTVRYVVDQYEFMTEGKLYEVLAVDPKANGFNVIDDDGDSSWWWIPRESRQFELVSQVPPKPVAPSTAVDKLLAEAATAEYLRVDARNREDSFDVAYYHGRVEALNWAIEVLTKGGA